MFQVRIEGDMESDLVNYNPKLPYSFSDSGVKRVVDGKQYSKYVEFDFEVNVEDIEEANNLKVFLEGLSGSSDGSGINVEIKQL